MGKVNVKNRDMTVRIKEKYLKEIKKRYNTYTLSKHMSMEQTLKILKGDASLNVKTLCKLCKLMDWDLPEYLEVIEKQNDKDN